jgi:hypothetical protein
MKMLEVKETRLANDWKGVDEERTKLFIYSFSFTGTSGANSPSECCDCFPITRCGAYLGAKVVSHTCHG